MWEVFVARTYVVLHPRPLYYRLRSSSQPSSHPGSSAQPSDLVSLDPVSSFIFRGKGALVDRLRRRHGA